MDEEPFPGWGLRPVELANRALFDSFLFSLAEPLSDYTFSQIYTWRNSLRILWKMVRGHLCVFANGAGDLTLLMPPIGDTGSDAALAETFELMNEYNARRGVPQRSRVEYASAELLARFDASKLSAQPMGADYVYDVRRMIDLPGGDLASKRQAKNRFIRNYAFRTEPYCQASHQDPCLRLLDHWKSHQDARRVEEPTAGTIKRSKESIATALCLQTAGQLGLQGIVVYVADAQPHECGDAATSATSRPQDDRFFPASSRLRVSASTSTIRGFTFGEHLGADQSSITIEKTDLQVKGLAQFIFSEFCRLHWADRPLVNVGDDWGLATLAWTKQSYRPVKLLAKYVLRRIPAVMTGPTQFPRPAEAA